MRITPPLVAATSILGMFFLIAPLLADDTKLYVNPRFGTCAELPVSFKQVGSSYNEDGATFAQRGLAGEIRIYGSYNVVTEDLRGYRDFVSNTLKQEGTEVSYEFDGSGWFVLSGRMSGEVFYLRVQGGTDPNPETVHHIWFQYPIALKATWDDIVTRYAKTLNSQCS